MSSSPPSSSETELSPPPVEQTEELAGPRAYSSTYFTRLYGYYSQADPVKHTVDNYDEQAHPINYQVTSRFTTKAQALAKSGHCNYTWARYQTPKAVFDALHEDDYSCRRVDVSNLAALAYRLTRTLVATCDHEISSMDMCPNSVVPKLWACRAAKPLVILPLGRDIFTALAAAAYLEGATVVSTREMPLYDIPAERMPKALLDALHLVEKLMKLGGQSTMFALAVTVGVHAGVSVVGHSPEGEGMGEILRGIPFGAPSGLILDNYKFDLPTHIPLGITYLQECVDELALKTAAAWAHCDPGITYGGSWSPTISSYSLDHEKGPPSPGGWALKHRRVVAALDRAMDMYLRALQKIFGLEGPICDIIRISGIAERLCDLDKYFDFPMIAPFYWIEPTTLLPRNLIGSPAEAAGAASLCDSHSEFEMPLFDDLAECPLLAPFIQSGWVASFKSPRTCGFVLHHHNRQFPVDHLSYMIPTKLSLDRIALPGGEGSLHARVEAREGLDKYLWSMDSICAPSELYNYAGKIGFMLNHANVSGNDAFRTGGLSYAYVHQNPKVTIGANRLQRATNSQPISQESRVQRAHVNEIWSMSFGSPYSQYQKGRGTLPYTLPCETAGKVMMGEQRQPEVERWGCPWCGFVHRDSSRTCMPLYAKTDRDEYTANQWDM